MPETTLLDRLRSSDILSAEQLKELSGLPEARDPDPKALGKVVFQRCWLTKFQINQVAMGKGRELFVGPYVLQDRLGEGGMGQVFKARHRHMKRIVALKLMRKEKLGSDEAIQRFYQEVEAAAQLTHPNIVMAFDAGQAGNLHFFSMEYVEGTDLTRLVREKGPLPVAQACDFIRQAALGLQHAHECGMVHRDIKPSNLLVTAGEKSVVKILDMGLARLGDTFKKERNLTKAGQVLGTPDYLAPEQAIDARNVDIRADIYSLGCSLFFLLTRRAPFQAESLAELLMKHQVEEPASLRSLRPNAPEALEELMRRLLAKKPEKRPVTPAAVATALEPFVRGEADGTPAIVHGNETWANLSSADAPSSGRRKQESSYDRTMERPSTRRGGRAAETLHGEPDHGERGDEHDHPRSSRRPEGGRRLLSGGMIAAAAGLAAFTCLLVAAVLWIALRAPSLQEEVARPSSPAAAPSLPRVKGGGATPVVAPREGKIELVRAFTPPAAAVRVMSLSHDGRQLLVGVGGAPGSDTDVCLWDVESGKDVRRLKGHTREVSATAFSPGGEQAVTGDRLGSLRLWNLKTGECLHSLQHGNSVVAAAWSPGGRHVSSVGDDLTVRVWDARTGKEVRRLAGPTRLVQCVTFAPDEQGSIRWLATGAGDGTVRLWDLTTGTSDFLAPEGGVWSMAASPAGRFLLTSSGNPTDAVRMVRLWNLGQRRMLARVGPGLDRTSCVAFAPDGRRALLGGETHGLTLLEVSSSGLTVVARGGTPGASCSRVAFTADGRQALSVAPDGFRLWKLPPPVGVAPALPPPTDVDLTPPAAAETLLAEQEQIQHREMVWSAAISGDGRKVVSGGGGAPRNGFVQTGADCDVRLWEVGGKKAPVLLAGHKRNVVAVALSRDGTRAASGSESGTIRVWDADKGMELLHWQGQRGQVNSLAFTPDHRYLVSGGSYGTLRLWDVATGKQVREFIGHTVPIMGVACSPDGRLILSGGEDSTVRLWDLSSGDSLRQFAGHTEFVRCVAFSPDGRLAVAGAGAFFKDKRWFRGSNHGLRVWETATGQSVQHIATLGDIPRCAAFTADGKHLAVGGEKNTIRLWNIATKEIKAEMTGHRNWVVSLAVAAEAPYLVSGSHDRTVRLWRLPDLGPAVPRP